MSSDDTCFWDKAFDEVRCEKHDGWASECPYVFDSRKLLQSLEIHKKEEE